MKTAKISSFFVKGQPLKSLENHEEKVILKTNALIHNEKVDSSNVKIRRSSRKKSNVALNVHDIDLSITHLESSFIDLTETTKTKKANRKLNMSCKNVSGSGKEEIVVNNSESDDISVEKTPKDLNDIPIIDQESSENVPTKTASIFLKKSSEKEVSKEIPKLEEVSETETTSKSVSKKKKNSTGKNRKEPKSLKLRTETDDKDLVKSDIEEKYNETMQAERKIVLAKQIETMSKTVVKTTPTCQSKLNFGQAPIKELSSSENSSVQSISSDSDLCSPKKQYSAEIIETPKGTKKKNPIRLKLTRYVYFIITHRIEMTHRGSI